MLGRRCPGASSLLRMPRTTCVTSCSRMVTSPPWANQSCMVDYLKHSAVSALAGYSLSCESLNVAAKLVKGYVLDTQIHEPVSK